MDYVRLGNCGLMVSRLGLGAMGFGSKSWRGWVLEIEEHFQIPFDPNHENMAGLEIHRDLPTHQLAANLRRAFSGIVAALRFQVQGGLTVDQAYP